MRDNRCLQLILALWAAVALAHGSLQEVECRPRQNSAVGFCANFPARSQFTAAPNFRGGSYFAEIEQELSSYSTMIQSGCSNALADFLCSYYYPSCYVLRYGNRRRALRLPPCQELCHYVRSSCEPVMARIGFSWPAHLDCSQFPSVCQTGACYPSYGSLQEYQNLQPVSVPGTFVWRYQKGTAIRLTDETTVSISVAGSLSTAVPEGQAAVVTVFLNKPAQHGFHVTLDTAELSAKSSDYHAGPYTVSFSPGQSRAAVSIPTIDDGIVEFPEAFLVRIADINSTSSDTIPCRDKLTVEITDNDVLTCGFSSHTFESVEGDNSSVILSCRDVHEISFALQVQTQDITAIGGEDYLPGTSYALFNQGQREATIAIPTLDNSVTELVETFSVRIVGSDQSSKVVIVGREAQVSIEDNDMTKCRVAAQNSSILEGTTGTVVVECRGEHDFDYNLHVTAAGGSATDADYRLPQTVTLRAGSELAIFDVAALSDGIEDDGETVAVDIESIDQPALVLVDGSQPCFITIRESIGIVCSLVPQNVSVFEGESARVVVTCSGSLNQDFNIFLDTKNSSAAAASDFQTGPFSISFKSGQTIGVLNIQSIIDELCEEEEEFRVFVSGSDSPGDVTIPRQDECFVFISDYLC